MQIRSSARQQTRLQRSLFFGATNARAHSCRACTRMASRYPLAMATAPIWWRAVNFAFSLVDSDDVVNRMKQHEPVTMVYPDQGADEIGCLIVPNAAVLIAGSPHQDAGKKLIDYLLSKETERKLAFSDAAQIPLHPGVATPPQLQPIESIKIMNSGLCGNRHKTTGDPVISERAGLRVLTHGETPDAGRRCALPRCDWPVAGPHDGGQHFLCAGEFSLTAYQALLASRTNNWRC